MKTITLELTEEQQRIVEPLIMSMKEGEATFAQVFIDGIKIAVLDEEMAQKVCIATGAPQGVGKRYVNGVNEPLHS